MQSTPLISPLLLDGRRASNPTMTALATIRVDRRDFAAAPVAAQPKE